MDVPTNDDGLKWFGEGFDGFPKRLPDDCVEYIIYIIDNKQSQDSFATRNRLNQIAKASQQSTKELLKDYIWQRDAFELKLYPQLDSSGNEKSPAPDVLSQQRRPYLKGRTSFGDSIADEWLIVYMLLEMSKQYPDAWIRVYDTDGEFLLIEAANALPKWLNPEIAENRVWISNGHLRIIPLATDQKASRNLAIEEAIALISRTPDKLIISPFIEDEAFHRVKDYPTAIRSSLHHAQITLPRSLAYLLHRKAAYISPAIESFYLRDPVSMKPLTTKDTSTLYFPPDDLVTTSVRFTKVGYAQVRSQVFETPPAWTGVLPKLRDGKVEMGMKVACGCEMLLQDEQNKNRKDVREMKMLLEDVNSSEEALPTDEDIASWPQVQDDEKWLDIDYNEFEKELSGQKKQGAKGAQTDGKGIGDATAQANLRKMVSRFEDFLDDDAAGADGAEGDDEDDDEDDSSSEVSSQGEDKDASFDEAEFEKAMKEMMGMPPDQVEESGLLDEARKLALEDEASVGSADVDEDEEMKNVMALMEQELKGHGALELNDGILKKTKKAVTPQQNGEKKKSVLFGPERPPSMNFKVQDVESADEEVGPGDEELSSDDEDYNDVDLGLAKNMLESFKGQAGLSGPAGNLMRSLGINMPRDEGSDSD